MGIENERWIPPGSTIDRLQMFLAASNIVKSTTLEPPQLLRIERSGKPPIRAFLLDLYIVGEADVLEVMSEHDIEAIVATSIFNEYTHDAKEACRKNGVGLFTFTELRGAVWYVGKRFLDYVPPNKD